MERYTDSTLSLRESLPSILNPLTQINYILGTFPFHINTKNGRVTLSSKSFHFYRAILTFFLMSLTTFSAIYRVIQIIMAPRILNSNGEPFPIMGKIVELVCSIYANTISLVILGLTFFNKKRLQSFFCGMISYGHELKSYIDSYSVGKMVRKLYALYVFLAMTSAGFVSARYYRKPEMGPVAVLIEILGIEMDVAPELKALMSAAFVFYIALAKYACLGYVEIISCGLGKCLRRCMENIMEELESQMEKWRRQVKGIKSQVTDKDDFINLLATATMDRSSPSGISPKFKFQNEFDNYIDQIRELNPGLISSSETVSASPKIITPKFSSTGRVQMLRTTPGKILSQAARAFSKVAEMQRVTNSVFGITLAINIGCIVGMSVILKYLVIKNLVADLGSAPITDASLMQNDTNFKENDSFAARNFSYAVSRVNLDGEINPYGLDDFGWIMFLGLDVSMFIRLGVVIILLGRVYQTSLRFNAIMNESFLTANQLIDELAETLQTSGNANDVDEITKTLITPTQTSSIMAFMNLYNSHPVAFTAGGLFVFSSGLLLMIISIIISYLVFLLQA